MKICCSCKQSLMSSCFTKHSHSADGLQSKCKACRKAYDQARYAVNREEQIARSREWNLANPERTRASGRRADSKRMGKQTAKKTQYVEYIKRATPAWADLQEIAMFYEVSDVLSRGGVRFHVDHIVPIRGKNCSGLHVSENLRVVPAHENLKKGNRFISQTI